jgi:voltage-gated potassium channel
MNAASGDRSVGFFQFAVLVLSVYALAALLVDLVVPLNPETSRLIQKFDNLVCAVFFIDFLQQFVRAPDKRAFMRLGWIDLLASIPAIDALRWGRLVRVLRILRLLRALRGTQKLYRIFRERRAVGGSVGLTAFMLILLSSLSILSVETAERSNIKTAGDALWWSLTTVTTVGYGDLYPVTPLGRTIAGLLMIAGVGLFGSFTAVVASYFTARDNNDDQNPVLQELQALRTEIQTLRQKLDDRS